MKNLKVIGLFLSLVLSCSSFAQQSKVAITTKSSAKKSKLPNGSWSFKKARLGTCITDVTRQTDQVLEEHGVKTSGIPKDKRDKIADALVLMDKLYGDKMPFFKGLTIKLVKSFNHLGKQVNDELIIVGPRGVKFVNIYIHELSHKIGNTERNGSRIYSEYNAFVTKRCLYTNYSKASHGNGARNEEFAEAFTGYITMPEVLLKAGGGCKLAYEYFATRLLPTKNQTCPMNNPNEGPTKAPKASDPIETLSTPTIPEGEKD